MTSSRKGPTFCPRSQRVSRFAPRKLAFYGLKGRRRAASGAVNALCGGARRLSVQPGPQSPQPAQATVTRNQLGHAHPQPARPRSPTTGTATLFPNRHSHARPQPAPSLGGSPGGPLWPRSHRSQLSTVSTLLAPVAQVATGRTRHRCRPGRPGWPGHLLMWLLAATPSPTDGIALLDLRARGYA